MRLYSPRHKKKSAFFEDESEKLNNISLNKTHCDTTQCDTSCDTSFSSKRFSLSTSRKHRRGPSRGPSSGSRGSARLGSFLQNYDSMMDSLSSMSFDSNKLFPDRVPEKISPSRPHRRSTRQSRNHCLERTTSTKAVCLQIDLPKRSNTGRDLARTTSAETVTMQFDPCFERSNSFSSLEDSILLERKRSHVRTNSSSLGDLFQEVPQDFFECRGKAMGKPITRTNSSSLGDLFQPAPRDFDNWQKEALVRRPAVRRNSSSSLGDLCQKVPRRSCVRTRSSSFGDLFRAAPRDFDAW